jgi:hypothetical protein
MCSCFCTAEAIGLPYLQPFLSKQQPQNLSRGANFAIVGGTALDEGFFLRHNACSVPPFRSSLRVQIGWFRKLKRALCNATATGAGCWDRDRLLARSLFMVGELGSNDYGYILAGGKSIREAKSFVPEVVLAICKGVEVHRTHLDICTSTHSFLDRIRSISSSKQFVAGKDAHCVPLSIDIMIYSMLCVFLDLII